MHQGERDKYRGMEEWSFMYLVWVDQGTNHQYVVMVLGIKHYRKKKEDKRLPATGTDLPDPGTESWRGLRSYLQEQDIIKYSGKGQETAKIWL